MRRIDLLTKYMEIKGLNDNQVTKECGLAIGLLNQARRGKSDLGKVSVEKILSKYQDLSRIYLLTGEGEMLKNTVINTTEDTTQDLSDNNSMKYYYELSATAGNTWINDNELNQPYRRINFPNYEGCVAFNISGESMYPTAKERDIVAIIPDDVQIIVNGEIYLVITRDGQRMVKRLLRSGKDETGATIITCISDNENQELYAPFTISGNDVHKIFRVKGFISSSLLA